MLSQSTEEQKLARGVAIGLPLVTLSVAGVVAMLAGAATSILVLAAGLLLGVISLLWGSLRVLSGDAPLSPELEELELSSRGVDGLSVRKEMLLRALKDLENEHAIGKIEPEDYEQLSSTYRQELKQVLKQIDASLAPYRARAEEAARAHLSRVGLIERGYRGDQPEPLPTVVEETVSTRASVEMESTPPADRKACPSCHAMNESDAKFCKECATRLVSHVTPAETSAPREDSTDAS